MSRSTRTLARESIRRAQNEVDAGEAPRLLNARDRRIVAWTIVLVVLGGYLVWQVIGLATVKDAVPPSWWITAPAGATIVGEPRTDYEPYRATTYVLVRPADDRTAEELLREMGLSQQPTQIGPTPLDWRPIWVYSEVTQGGVELRLVYRQDGS